MTISQFSILIALIIELHLPKYYQCNIKHEWKNTLTTREHGLGKLLDQGISLLLVLVVRMGHVIETRVLAEERSDLLILLICERLWEFRVPCVFISTVFTFLTCRRFITSTSPGRLGLFSPCCFTCFPAPGLLLLSWGIFYWKNMNKSELWTVLPPWSLCVLRLCASVRLHSIACRFLPLHFGRCPTGRRRMRKSEEASGGRRSNFNCKLNLPGHHWMSAGWVLNWRITAGFLQDSSHGSPHGDPAIDFALLWRRL